MKVHKTQLSMSYPSGYLKIKKKKTNFFYSHFILRCIVYILFCYVCMVSKRTKTRQLPARNSEIMRYAFLEENIGSGVLNPGAVFLRFVTEAFLLFLAPAGQIV